MAASTNKKALEEKEKGNKFFLNKDYPNAIKHYSAAIDNDKNDYTFWSNRAASFLGLNDFKNALSDATQSVTLKSDWSKGYYRQGLAFWGLNDIDAAYFALEKALQYDPTNQDIKQKVAEANAERRKPKKLVLMVNLSLIGKLQKKKETGIIRNLVMRKQLNIILKL